MHVENVIFEFFVEDAGLNLKRGLRALHPVLQTAQSSGRFGGHVDAVDHPQQPGGDGEDGDDANEHAGTHSAGAHGGDFAVGGETAQSDQDTDEGAHGQSNHERGGQGIEEDFADAGKRSAVADDQLKQASEVAHEDDKGEQHHAEQGVGADFLQNVAGEDAHKVLV